MYLFFLPLYNFALLYVDMSHKITKKYIQEYFCIAPYCRWFGSVKMWVTDISPVCLSFSVHHCLYLCLPPFSLLCTSVSLSSEPHLLNSAKHYSLFPSVSTPVLSFQRILSFPISSILLLWLLSPLFFYFQPPPSTSYPFLASHPGALVFYLTCRHVVYSIWGGCFHHKKQQAKSPNHSEAQDSNTPKV